jgi:hypothetical protein
MMMILKARKNTDAAKRRILLKSVPGDGGETTQLQFHLLQTRRAMQAVHMVFSITAGLNYTGMETRRL